MNEEIDKSLEKLKAKSHTYAKDAQEIIQSYEDDLINLRLEKEWLDNPNTDKFKQYVLDYIGSINALLVNSEDMSEEDRKLMFRFKKFLLPFLNQLSRNPDQDLKTLESKINYELYD